MLVVLTLAKLPTLSVTPVVSPVLNTSSRGNTLDSTPVSDTATLTVAVRSNAESGVIVKVAVSPATTIAGSSVTVNVTCSNTGRGVTLSVCVGVFIFVNAPPPLTVICTVAVCDSVSSVFSDNVPAIAPFATVSVVGNVPLSAVPVAVTSTSSVMSRGSAPLVDVTVSVAGVPATTLGALSDTSSVTICGVTVSISVGVFIVVNASPLTLNSTVLVVLTLAKLPTLSVKAVVSPVLNTSVLGNTPDNTPVSDTNTLTVTNRGNAESGVIVRVAVAPATTVSGFSVTVNVTCSNTTVGGGTTGARGVTVSVCVAPFTVVEASPLTLNSTVLVVLTLAKLPTLSVKPVVSPVLNTSVLGNTPDNTPVSDADTLTVTKRGNAESGVTVKVAVAPATTVSGFSVTVNVTCSNTTVGGGTTTG